MPTGQVAQKVKRQALVYYYYNSYYLLLLYNYNTADILEQKKKSFVYPVLNDEVRKRWGSKGYISLGGLVSIT